ncbi:phage tail protein [Pseudomonas aeruginosa]
MSTKKYGGFLTGVGAAKQIEAAAGGTRRSITHMLIGDAGGEPGDTPDPVPMPEQKALVRQRYRVALNRLEPSPDPTVLVAEAVLPQSVGGWWIREIGLEDADGDLVAVANCAPAYKPLVTEGTGRTQTIRLHIAVSHADTVNLLIDPSVILATVADVEHALLSVEATRDATGRMQRDGSGALRLPLTLAKTGVKPGTYPKITVDEKGRATGGEKLLASDIPDVDAGKISSGVLPIARGGTGNNRGEAITSARLTAARRIATDGAATGSVEFDGSRDVSLMLALAKSGVTPGSYPVVSVNDRGLVTAGRALKSPEIPDLDASKITSGELNPLRLPPHARGLIPRALAGSLDPNAATIPLILSNHENVPVPGHYFYISTTFYPNDQWNAAQTAIKYADAVQMYVRSSYQSQQPAAPGERVWSPWVRCDVGGAFAKTPDGQLGSGVDLNYFTGSGWVHQPGDAQAASGYNYPVKNAGILIVRRATPSFIYQTYTTYMGDQFQRCCYAGQWRPWAHVFSSRNVIPITNGGTGAGNADQARANLGAGRPATFLNSSNGWYRDNDNGLMLQWITIHIGDHPGSVLDRAVTFPTAFPSACWHVVPSVREDGRPAASASSVTLADKSLTRTGCVIVASEYFGMVQNFSIRVLAIGY